MGSNELVDCRDARRVVPVAAADGFGKGSIITPEAVVLDFELAGLASRSIAYAIDIAVQFGALMAYLVVVGAISAASPVVGIVLMLVGLIVIVLGYPVIMETFRGGRTLGRMVVKTRVVTVEGAPVRFRHALIRSLLGIIDLLISVGAVAVVTSLLTKRGQRLGDLVAGTMVIREPSVGASSGSIYFWPPQYLAEWSRTVDTRALGNETYQLVRDFLSNPDMADEPRAVIADDLALLVSERLPHAARTPAVPSIDYLTAIASATQEPTGGYPPPPPKRSAVQPPPPGVRYAAPADPQAAPLFRTPSAVQPPPPVAAPRVQLPPSVGAAPVQPSPAVAYPPGQQPAQPAPAAETPAPPAPPAPNDGGFAAPG